MKDIEELVPVIDEEEMKPERIQFRFDELYGWVMVDAEGHITTSAAKAVALWTAFELSDPYEACELVAEIGPITDVHSVRPEIDVRANLVFVTATTPEVGLTEADFDFAASLDRELGASQKASGLIEAGH